MGEEILQTWIVEAFRPLLEQFLAQRRERVFVGADQFIYWQQFSPTKAVASDVYVMPGVDPSTPVTCWKLWESGVVPTFALEVVTPDAGKDYDDAPRRYAELGVPELVIFDPHADERPERVRWQVYRRIARRGFVLVCATGADRVQSKALRCWLRQLGRGPETRLRLATGKRGERVVATREEKLEAETARLRAALDRLRRGA